MESRLGLAVEGRLFVQKRARDVALVAAGSVFVALTAQLSVPLPFSPVPLTGQTFGVVLVGAVLGRNRGAAALLAYLLEGLAGLPVFAGAAGGPAVLLGPTGGYLVGFIPAAWLAGFCKDRGWTRRIASRWVWLFVASLAPFVTGLLWLSRFVPADQLMAVGLWPFLPGALIKTTLAAMLLPIGSRLIRDRMP
jgi:biotin transport system substrate-specific component